jgi:LytR cell envelope-related transcriptional attenuator
MSTLSPLARYGGRGHRRLRTALVLLFGLAALAVAGWIGWHLSGHDAKPKAGPSTTVSAPRNSCSASASASKTGSSSKSASPSKRASTSKSGAKASSSKTPKPHPSRSPSPSAGNKLPKPKAITLNVYNSTTRNGLARKTATLLGDRGFTIGSVKNDPAPKAVKGAAEVRFGPRGALAARVVAAEVQGAKLVEDKRSSADVDIALGAAFKHLASPAQVKAALSPSPSPTKSC